MTKNTDNKKVRCAFCGVEMTEARSNNPQDYLHPEYEKYVDSRFADIKPRYCCSYCTGLTSINRTLYGLIHVENRSIFMSPARVALALEDEADYLEKNANEIKKYYEKIREKVTEKEAKGGFNDKD